MEIFKKNVNRLNRLAFICIGILLGIMAVVIILQVFCRIFQGSLPWSEELARYLMVYIVFIGTGCAVRSDQLMSVKILQDLLSPARKKIVEIAVNLLVLGFAALLALKGHAILAVVGRQVSPAMGWSMAIPYAALAIGGALMALNAAAGILESLFGKGAEQ